MHKKKKRKEQKLKKNKIQESKILQKQQTIANNNHNKIIISYLQVQLTTTKLQLQGKRENRCHHIAGPSISKSF